MVTDYKNAILRKTRLNFCFIITVRYSYIHACNFVNFFQISIIFLTYIFDIALYENKKKNKCSFQNLMMSCNPLIHVQFIINVVKFVAPDAL